MDKIKVKIVEGFKKTSGFGWRFVPKWKREFIRLNGMNAFEVITKGLTIDKESTREIFFCGLKIQKAYIIPKNTKSESDVFKFHNGLDFIGSDTRLLAIADGIIMRSNYDDLSGNYIKIQHTFDGIDYVLSYCHLKNLVELKKGDMISVKKGEWIAVMGNSGVTSTGVHCHLTVKNLETGEIIDPESVFEFEV